MSKLSKKWTKSFWQSNKGSMDEEKVREIFMAIFLILIMTAFCVAIISSECDSDKPNEEKRDKVIVPIQLDKNNYTFISL